MGFIKRLFGLEKKEEPSQDAENIVQTSKEFREDICDLCKEPIGLERYRWVNGKIVHKRCFKMGEKLVLNGR